MSAPSVRGSSPASVLALKNRVRALVFSIRPVTVSTESSRARPAVSPLRGIVGTSAKFIELVRERGAGSIDSLFRSSSSLFAQKNSLLESVGNSFPAGWICTGISAAPASVMRETGEIPCILPADQGTDPRDEFAPDSTHRH